MTTGRTKVPPIVPLKKPQLKGKSEKLSQPSLAAVVAELSLDTTYNVAKPRNNEPKPLNFDSLINTNPLQHIKETHIKREQKKPAPLVKQKPPVKPKPSVDLNNIHKLQSKPTVQPATLSQKQTLLNDILHSQLKRVSAGQTPSMAAIIPHSTSRQESTQSPNSSISSQSSTLSHATKSRARGPKRRLPSTLFRPHTTETYTSKTFSAQSTLKKKPPPVPSKTRKPNLTPSQMASRTHTV